MILLTKTKGEMIPASVLPGPQYKVLKQGNSLFIAVGSIGVRALLVWRPIVKISDGALLLCFPLILSKSL